MEIFTLNESPQKLELEMYADLLPAGFASLMDGYKDKKLDINEYLVEYPSATFLIRVEGLSMKDAGILPGDILVVDRSKNIVSGDVVVALLDGQFMVKRFVKKQGKIILQAENKDFEDVQISSEAELTVWGKVVGSFRKFL